MLRIAAALIAAFAIAACTPKASGVLVEGDFTLGPADAKVTVIEYFSPLCPGCKAFHDEFWPTLKKDYVDAGKVKFVAREWDTHGTVDFAITSLARCSGKERYFDVLDYGFENQRELALSSSSAEGAKPSVVAMGAKFGMSEEDVSACLKKPENIARHDEVFKLAAADGAGGTPTFIVNGTRIDTPSNIVADDWAATRAAIDAELAK
jgi:protein-disulfide isomerase